MTPKTPSELALKFAAEYVAMAYGSTHDKMIANLACIIGYEAGHKAAQAENGGKVADLEFDEQGAREMSSGNPTFITGARWQFEKDKAVIAAKDAEIAQLRAERDSFQQKYFQAAHDWDERMKMYRELEEQLQVLQQENERYKTRINGMILGLKEHGQNINVQFHIDWLEKALTKEPAE